VEGQNEPMQEGESGTPLKKLGHMGTTIEGVMPCTPGLQGGSGNLKLFGGLTLRDALSLQLEILRKPVGPIEAVPARVTVDMVMVGKIDYSAHGYLSPQAIDRVRILMAKDGEVALRLQL
jgi:hypothetical protein